MIEKKDGFLDIGILFNNAYKVLRREFDNKIREVLPELGYSEIRVLMEIKSSKNGLKQIDIANLLCVRPISLSKIIDKLEHAGLVKRLSVKNDRRSKIIVLNNDAKDLKKLFSAMHDISSSIINRALRGVSTNDLSIFTNVLMTMKNNFS